MTDRDPDYDIYRDSKNSSLDWLVTIRLKTGRDWDETNQNLSLPTISVTTKTSSQNFKFFCIL